MFHTTSAALHHLNLQEMLIVGDLLNGSYKPHQLKPGHSESTSLAFYCALRKSLHCSTGRQRSEPLWPNKSQKIVQIRSMTEGRGHGTKQFLDSEGCTAGCEDAPSWSRKDTNAPEMNRALKTW